MCGYFPVAINGRIDWEKIKTKQVLDDCSEVLDFTRVTDDDVLYIIWNDGSYPVVQSKLKKVIEVIDNVTAVSFDTWLFHPTFPFVIEFYHEGEIIYGSLSVGQ